MRAEADRVIAEAVTKAEAEAETAIAAARDKAEAEIHPPEEVLKAAADFVFAAVAGDGR
jgi:vacuolar-type H+-ATPase subunit H